MRQRAAYFNLVVPGSPWTEEEDARLRELLPTHRQSEIAAILGRPKQGVYTRCSRLKLPSPHDRIVRGEAHYLYVGNPPKNDYGKDWWEITKPAVLVRDGYRCLECGRTDRLTAHHIIPFRLTHDNRMENHATLCKSCHMRQKAHRWLEVKSVSLLPGYQQKILAV